MKMTQTEKMLKVHDTLMDFTETFEPIALHLSYLYPAILRDGCIDIDKSNKPDDVFLRLMTVVFPKKHFVWKHINIRA